MSMSGKGPPMSHRQRVENKMVRKREQEMQRAMEWTDRSRYYEEFQRKNSKYGEWTSPRYYNNQCQLFEKIKNERDREEMLKKRQEKLKKLLDEEDELYKIELMVHQTKSSPFYRSVDDTAVLKDVNDDLKLEEIDRQKHEAELNLYHQWRTTNPVLQHYERMHRGRNLKLSWLDQQIENRMRKEQEEAENRKLLQERERKRKEAEREEQRIQKEILLKREELKQGLDEQCAELEQKTQLCQELRRKEDEELRKKFDLDQINERLIEDERKRRDFECALYNIKHHKLRLKQKAEAVQRKLSEEQEMFRQVEKLELIECMENEERKLEIKEALKQFVALNEQQKLLERNRLKHLDFLFDSEAEYQCQQQAVVWKQEEEARVQLMKDVLKTIQEQIDANLKKNRDRQMEVVKEREDLVKKIEEYNEELHRLKMDEEKRKIEMRRQLDDCVQSKSMRKKEMENVELKKTNEELMRIQKEEERLKREILNIQRRQGLIKPPRSKLFL